MFNYENIDNNVVRIKTIGVGGGGNNAALHIINENVKNIETYLVNTEMGVLKRTNCNNIVQIGKQTTKGLGAGANEKIGEMAARESKKKSKNITKYRYAICNSWNGRRNRNRSSTSNCRNC